MIFYNSYVKIIAHFISDRKILFGFVFFLFLFLLLFTKFSVKKGALRKIFIFSSPFSCELSSIHGIFALYFNICSSHEYNLQRRICGSERRVCYAQ